jgi:hypothetical protein
MRTKPITKENTAPAVTCNAPWRLIKVKPLKHYKLKVEFVNGTQGIVEMEQMISREKAGVLVTLRDPTIFNQVHLEHGAVTWPGEIDLAPDAMHEEIRQHGKWILR